MPSCQVARPLKKRPLHQFSTVPLTTASVPSRVGKELIPSKVGRAIKEMDDKNQEEAQDLEMTEECWKSKEIPMGSDILDSLPRSILDKFGTLGFALKNKKKYTPAKVMNPFDVPKLDREVWKREYRTLRDSGESLEKLSLLVYWFGHPQCYSLIPQTDFISYGEATPKLLHYAARARQNKYDNVPLSSSQQRRLREMDELLNEMNSNTTIISEEDEEEDTIPGQDISYPENGGFLQLKKRPRGRPPVGKVWDPVKGIYMNGDGENLLAENTAASNEQESTQEIIALEKKLEDSALDNSHQNPSLIKVSVSNELSHRADDENHHDKSCPNHHQISRNQNQISITGEHLRSKYSQKKLQRMEKLLEVAIKDAKNRLEREKALVSRLLPESIARNFGDVGFAKWGKVYLPALVLSPFQAPPGQARDMWMNLFHDMKSDVQSLSKMSLLVFWYGQMERSNFYSLVPANAFVPYHQATDKMLDYAKAAELKRAAMKKLTSEDKQRIRAMEELTEDLAKDRADRKRGTWNFLERHELLNLEDMEDVDMDTEDEKELEGSEPEDDDGFSSLEDSEDDLNDEKSRLSCSSNDEDDEDALAARKRRRFGKGDDGTLGKKEKKVLEDGGQVSLAVVTSECSKESQSDLISGTCDQQLSAACKSGGTKDSDLDSSSSCCGKRKCSSSSTADVETCDAVQSAPVCSGQTVLKSPFDFTSVYETVLEKTSSSSSNFLPVDQNHPVFQMCMQIVQQVCRERDLALEKVATLEALLESKSED